MPETKPEIRTTKAPAGNQSNERFPVLTKYESTNTIPRVQFNKDARKNKMDRNAGDTGQRSAKSNGHNELTHTQREAYLQQ